MKLLRAQGLPVTQLNLTTVFQSLILNKIRYAIPAWSGFLSIHLVSQINGQRCYKYGYCFRINTVEEFIESANYKLFRSLQNPQHCLHSLLPPTKPLNHDLRPKGHNYQIHEQLLHRAA